MKKVKMSIDDIYNNKLNCLKFGTDNLTEEQLSIINSKYKRILVDSVAGSGKTKTIEEYAKRNIDKRILYTTFSKSMVNEATERFKGMSHVEIRTLHSLAYKHIGYKYKNKLTTELNIFDYAKCIGLFMENSQQFEYISELKKTFEIYLSSPYKSIDIMCKKCPSISIFKSNLKKIYTNSKNIKSKMKIEHNFYLKEWCLSNPDLKQYNVLLLDEIQDFNGAFLGIIPKLKNEKIIGVGDSRQNIFEFANTTNAFDILKDGWTDYKLTKSFRIGNTLAKIIQDIIINKTNDDNFQIQGYNKEQKIVKYINEDERHMVLCRYNSTIIKNVLNNIAKGKKCYIEGGNAKINFSFIEKMYNFKFKNKQHFTLKKYKNYEHMILFAKKSKDNNILLCDTLIKTYRYGLGDILKNAENSLVKEFKDADIGFSTVHKIKGKTIYTPVLIGEDLINLGDIDIKENASELNIFYVANTRCKGKICLSKTTLDYYLSPLSFLNNPNHKDRIKCNTKLNNHKNNLTTYEIELIKRDGNLKKFDFIDEIAFDESTEGV